MIPVDIPEIPHPDAARMRQPRLRNLKKIPPAQNAPGRGILQAASADFLVGLL